ncbi:MAG TPA: putative sulfate exporter family transporter [Spirochaetia bacterium]|nr:putative sulfate exporter family transporter [Spirochaetia bacterium]
MKKIIDGFLRVAPGVLLLAALGIGGWFLAKWLQSVITVAWGQSLASTVIVAIVGGLLIGNLVPIPRVFAAGIASYEFFLKVGIVLMGARFLVTDVARLGGMGLLMVVVEILFSIAFVGLVARLFRLPEKLGTLLSVGVGICGVTAIMGAAGSIEAEKEQTGYAIAVILIFGAAALVAYPLIGRALAMSDKAFGIWAGLAVDNTAEAVATGAIYSKAALAYTTLAKLCRNALMGFVILGFAVWYSRRGLAKSVEHKGLFLWQKFPKFVIGFLGLSVIFSVLLAVFPSGSAHSYVAGRVTALKNYSEWAFQFTFVGVGLRTTFRDMVKTGAKPLVVGVAAEAAVAAFTIGLVFLVVGSLPTL